MAAPLLPQRGVPDQGGVTDSLQPRGRAPHPSSSALRSHAGHPRGPASACHLAQGGQDEDVPPMTHSGVCSGCQGAGQLWRLQGSVQNESTACARGAI